MNENLWNIYDNEQKEKMNTFIEDYKSFLNDAKTERECITLARKILEDNGFKNLNRCNSLHPGDRVYAENMRKNLMMLCIGERDIEDGMNIAAAHVDSPRFDIKPNPLFESEELIYLDTHYYGAIKKHQWVNTPLAIHGVVVKKDMTKINVCIGENADEPVFVITDLLFHLYRKEQGEKKLSEAFEGEKMDLVIGNDIADDKKDTLKKIKQVIAKEYGFEEEDFASAELEVVPAGRARDCGLDRSMVLAYGQDDKICAFPLLRAFLNNPKPAVTSCCFFVDKEEIGNVGATGAQSRFFENTVAEVVELIKGESELAVRRCMANSHLLAADVTSAYDPAYADVFEIKNTSRFAHGLSISKYTGYNGKDDANDANAEYIAKLRNIFDNEKVAYQFGEMGKVDAGGGFTIAYTMAKYGMETIDAGIGLIGMHAAYELSSKADIYEAYRAYCAYYKAEID